MSERGTYIKGLIWPPLEQKTENCFSQISFDNLCPSHCSNMKESHYNVMLNDLLTNISRARYFPMGFPHGDSQSGILKKKTATTI